MLYIYLKYLSLKYRIRAWLVFVLSGAKFKRVGKETKVRGKGINTAATVVIGDYCWIEAVNNYRGFDGVQSFTPKIILHDRVAMSDFVHISAINHIEIGAGTLIGSKVYIGDQSHGSYKDFGKWKRLKDISPALRPLGDSSPIFIGKNCWIGDGAVILAGADIGDNCVIAANSVVKGSFSKDCIIGGIPAKVLKNMELD